MSWRVGRAIRQEGWSGEVIAVHARSCYLSADDAEIYAVVQQPLGNGPLNLVVAASQGQLFQRLSPGTSANSTGAQLQLGADLEVDLSPATLWDPKAYLALGADADGLRRCLAELYRAATTRAPEKSLARLLPHLQTDDLPPAFQAVGHFPRSHALIGGLSDSLAHRNRRSLKVVISSLAGLGPGLTPAGDDFLAGVLLVLALACEQRPDPELTQIASLMLETAVPRTHEISAAYLRAAHAGEVGERWHPLLEALSASDVDRVGSAADAVMTTGETSGADMVAGFIIGMGAVYGGSLTAWQNTVLPEETLHSAKTLPPTG